VGMMYLVTFLITVFLFGYWLVMLYYKKTEERDKALQLALQRNKNRYKRNQSQQTPRRV
jgi:Na+/melibiose symporter-like transporter